MLRELFCGVKKALESDPIYNKSYDECGKFERSLGKCNFRRIDWIAQNCVKVKRANIDRVLIPVNVSSISSTESFRILDLSRLFHLSIDHSHTISVNSPLDKYFRGREHAKSFRLNNIQRKKRGYH